MASQTSSLIGATLQQATARAISTFIPAFAIGQTVVSLLAKKGSGGPVALQSLAACIGTRDAAVLACLVRKAYGTQQGGLVLGQLAQALERERGCSARGRPVNMVVTLVNDVLCGKPSQARASLWELLRRAGIRPPRVVTDQHVADARKVILGLG